MKIYALVVVRVKESPPDSSSECCTALKRLRLSLSRFDNAETAVSLGDLSHCQEVVSYSYSLIRGIECDAARGEPGYKYIDLFERSLLNINEVAADLASVVIALNTAMPNSQLNYTHFTEDNHGES